MQNFQETRKRSFISAFSICMKKQIVQDVLWTSHVRSIYILCLRGTFQFQNETKDQSDSRMILFNSLRNIHSFYIFSNIDNL